MSRVGTVSTPVGDARPVDDGVPEGVRSHHRARWIAQRFANAAFVLWGVATLTWIAVKTGPDDEAIAIAGGITLPPPEVLAEIRTRYGLDKPLIVQYLDYFRHLLTGDLGYSTSQRRPVAAVIAANVVPTAELVAAATFMAWGIVIVWSLLTIKRRWPIPAIGSGLELVLVSLPQYWLGMLLLEVFAFRLGWVPTIGATGLGGLILPALTIAIPLAGFIGLVTRQGFEAVLEQPFVTSARARGMSDWGVRLHHVLPHAILPGLTLSGWVIGAELSGAVLVESLFARPGIGSLLLVAVTLHDTSLTIGITLIVALVFVLANMLVDGLYQFADPRMNAAS